MRETTLADVFDYLARARREHIAKSWGTYWLESAITDLWVGNPDKALDCLSFVQGPYTHDEYLAHKKEFEKAKRLLKFLEKRYNREGRVHNFDKRP